MSASDPTTYRAMPFSGLQDAEPVCHCGLTVAECEARGLEPCPEREP